MIKCDSDWPVFEHVWGWRMTSGFLALEICSWILAQIPVNVSSGHIPIPAGSSHVQSWACHIQIRRSNMPSQDGPRLMRRAELLVSRASSWFARESKKPWYSGDTEQDWLVSVALTVFLHTSRASSTEIARYNVTTYNTITRTPHGSNCFLSIKLIAPRTQRLMSIDQQQC